VLKPDSYNASAVQNTHASVARRLLGITLLVLFFAFGCLAAGLSAMLLLFPGTALDSLWLVVVSSACATAAAGLWRRAVWGLWTAAAILAINLIGDTANALFAHDYRALIGLPIGGLMLAYLLLQRRSFTNADFDSRR